MNIYIPGTCLSSFLWVEPSKKRPFSIKTMGHLIFHNYDKGKLDPPVDGWDLLNDNDDIFR